MTTSSLTVEPSTVDVGVLHDNGGAPFVLLTGEGSQQHVRFYAHLTATCARDIAKRLMQAADRCLAEGGGE